MGKVYQIKAKIAGNSIRNARYGHCILDVPVIARIARPGQCVNIRISDGLDPLLRRPFGVHRVDGTKISILYEIVGRGTALLAQKRPGECVDIVGPFGNGFDYSVRTMGRGETVFVAGGMGVAPLVFLAEKLSGRHQSSGARPPLVLLGAKTKKDILCEKEFRSFGCAIKVSTDDGSAGARGFVTGLLESHLQAAGGGRQAAIFACGPQPMMREVSRIAAGSAVSAQLSLESHMSCAIGACLGCVVKTIDGYKRVCKEGPVFDSRVIVWE